MIHNLWTVAESLLFLVYIILMTVELVLLGLISLLIKSGIWLFVKVTKSLPKSTVLIKTAVKSKNVDLNKNT